MDGIKYPALQSYCLASTQDLMLSLAIRFGVEITSSPYGDYIFVDNGANTLAVCHLDTVADIRYDYIQTGEKTQKAVPMQVRYKEFRANSHKKHKHYGVPTLYSSSRVVQSLALDDRLGLFMILDILPDLGVKSDYLFTTDEERGNSSAYGFYSTKEYHWMYQFDRRQFDPVLYQYDHAELRAKLAAHNFKVARGSYSDIASLEHLGICGINFGIGYDYEHSHNCVASMESVQAIGRKFAQFYHAFKNTPMPFFDRYEATPKTSTKDDHYYNDWIERDSLNAAYFKDEADWESETGAKTHYDLGELACDFCGAPAEFVVNLDTDYFLCYWCKKEIRPDPADADYVPQDD